MTVDPFDMPKPKTKRNGKDMPLVVPPGRKNAVGYTRTTTYVGCIEDTHRLELWQMRMVALGLADRPDLLLSVAAHRDDKDELDRITDAAKEAAKGSAKATIGTSLHRIAERIDSGEDPGIIPAAFVADVEAYRRITKGIRWQHIEKLMVLDSHKVAGTPDRIGTLPARMVDPDGVKGGRRIIDLKTGRVDFGGVKMAMQLAVYSRSVLYHQDTDVRTDPDVNQDWAVIIFQPQGTGTAQLYWVNIKAGWKDVQTAKAVRAARNGKPLTPFGAAVVVPQAPTTAPAPVTPAPVPAVDPVPVAGPPVVLNPHAIGDPTQTPIVRVAPAAWDWHAIREDIAVADMDGLKAIWDTLHTRPEWDLYLTNLVRARKAVLS